ncbi:MAG: DUF934 domain-containing protein [Rhodocyclaceae bacterium]
MSSVNTNLIKLNAGVASIATDDAWQIVRLPVIETEVKKQAGKVVLFKLTGAETATAEQIAGTEIPAGKVVVPFVVWQARREALAARVAAGEVGVWLETHELVEDLAAQADVNAFPVIAIHVERFADGRIYSAGALLRSRFGFKNELRAFGDVLRDQLFFFKRCGFDAYQIRADRSAEDALPSLNDFSDPYQGATVIDQPVWRRHARV